jgi:hypothetical protein
MEKLGGMAVDESHATFRKGDIIVVPYSCGNAKLPDLSVVVKIERLELFPNRFLSTLNPDAGIGYYAAVLGPLPFAIGNLEPDVFEVFETTF